MLASRGHEIKHQGYRSQNQAPLGQLLLPLQPLLRHYLPGQGSQVYPVPLEGNFRRQNFLLLSKWA